jgi:hypothetical protein
MQRALRELLTQCEHTDAGLPCPIIGTIRAPFIEREAAPPKARGAPVTVETKRRQAVRRQRQ